MVFSGLSPLVIQDVTDEGERIVVRARTPTEAAVCPTCGEPSGRVHGYQLRTVADVPVDDRRVVVLVRVRRLVCPTRGCCHTFREQVPGVLERYQRRTIRLTRQVKAVVKELAGRAGARLPAILAAGLSRHTALRTLLRIPLTTGRTPPRDRCRPLRSAQAAPLCHRRDRHRDPVWHNLCEAAWCSRSWWTCWWCAACWGTAVMRLLGRAPSWAPGPLARFCARLGIEEPTCRPTTPPAGRYPSPRAEPCERGAGDTSAPRRGLTAPAAPAARTYDDRGDDGSRPPGSGAAAA
jgi:hypothetical protein